jgi:hypothetical protein
MKRKYYVYIYVDNGLPFYVGKGFGRRDTEHTRHKHDLNRQDIFHNKLRGMILEGREWQVVRLFEPLFESEAFAWEIGLIAHWGRRDLGTGILCNMTDGGDGCSGYVWSDEQRKVRSQIMTEIANRPGEGEKRSQRGIERYSDPAERIAQSLRSIKLWKRSGAREAQSQRTAEQWNQPGAREVQGEKMMERMNQPGAREKMSKLHIERYNLPGAREAQSLQSIEQWNRPGAREAQSQRMTEIANRPGAREALSLRSTKYSRERYAANQVYAIGEWWYRVDLARVFNIKTQTLEARIKSGVAPSWACLYSPGKWHRYPDYCKPKHIPRIFGTRPSGEAFDYMYEEILNAGSLSTSPRECLSV